jgi:hypothetical protein
MEVESKYLPSKLDRIAFIKTRIEENKKQLFGGTLQVKLVAHNKTEVDQVEYNMKNLVHDIDIYEKELKELE